jgi:hypothetical protein
MLKVFWLLSIFASFYVQAAEPTPCGLEGTVEDRIKDCAVQDGSVHGNFTLVTRTTEFKEIYLDEKSKLLWSDRLADGMTHFKAQESCKSDLAEVVNVKGLTWRLPSIDEYKEADKNGARAALPNMSDWFWSSSVVRDNSYYAWAFVGHSGDVDYGKRSYYYYLVRCVAAR